MKQSSETSEREEENEENEENEEEEEEEVQVQEGENEHEYLGNTGAYLTLHDRTLPDLT